MLHASVTDGGIPAPLKSGIWPDMSSMTGLSKGGALQYEDDLDGRLHLVQSLSIPRVISYYLAFTDRKSSVS